MSNLLSIQEIRSPTGRRFKEVELDGLGVVRIRSLTTSEYAKVEALSTRSLMNINSKKKAEGERLLKVAKYELIKLCVVDADGSPIGLTNEDLDKIDYAYVSSLEEQCTEHCGIGGVDVEEAAKNSSETQQGST